MRTDWTVEFVPYATVQSPQNHWGKNMPIETRDMEQLMDSYLDNLADDIFTHSQENLVKNGSVDTGQLLTTGNVNREFLEKTIVYPAPHAAWIEFGTGPHPVSRRGISALELWAARKLGLSPKDAKRAAFAIAARIRKEGTEAKPFLRPAVDEALARRKII